MTETLDVLDPKLALSCNQTLTNFVQSLNQHSKILKENVDGLKSMVLRLETLSTKLTTLEKNEAKDIKLYSTDIVNEINSQILTETNDILSKSQRLIQEIRTSNEELSALHKELLIAAVALRSHKECSLIEGNQKQKSLAYYTEDACEILQLWRNYHRKIAIFQNHLNIREMKTIEQYRESLDFPNALTECLENYLLFSSFILKRNK